MNPKHFQEIPSLPQRPQRSHKGTFGQVLIVGGSECMSGAAYFSAKAAYRSGTGLVRILTHSSNRVIYQSQLPEALLSIYDKDNPFVLHKAITERTTSAAIGMGLSQDSLAARVLGSVLERASFPVVLDADALNIISKDRALLGLSAVSKAITPHPAELSRLMSCNVSSICADIPKAALHAAGELGTVCILKDHNTAVASPDGRLYINHTGNSGMATGGSGDVLAGMIASFSAQGMPLFEASVLGVYLHGSAGDIAAAKYGEHSLIASDIIDSIPSAILQYSQIFKN